jgi:hypothetical protein
MFSTAIMAAANAKDRHASARKDRLSSARIVCNDRSCSNRGSAAPLLIDANGNEIVGIRPSERPHIFSGSKALYIWRPPKGSNCVTAFCVRTVTGNFVALAVLAKCR